MGIIGLRQRKKQRKILHLPFLVFYSFQTIVHDALVHHPGSIAQQSLAVEIALGIYKN